MSSMQVVSSQTTMAPEPSMEPASARALKSRRTSIIEAGRKPEDGPDGAKAFIGRPPRTPPAWLKMTSCMGTPMGTSKMPGRVTWPLTPTNFSPRDPPAPCATNQSTPRARICGTLIKDAALRAGDEAGNNHAFDEEMRQVSHDEAVFDGAGLAFVGVADDVLHGIGLFAHQVPLHAGGKSGAAHAFQFGGFELCEDVIPGLGLNELAYHAVLFSLAIRIGFAGDSCLLGMWLVDVVAANGAAGDLLGMRGGDVRENVIVDGDCRSMIAAAEAGNAANLHIFRPRIREAALEIGAQLASEIG